MAFSWNVLAVLHGIAWLTLAAWLALAWLTWRGLRRVKPLMPVAGDELRDEDAPLVSILVPARNEEGRVLTAAVGSMLAQDYGGFEIVAVNDRSTDATGAILKSMAVADGRLRVIDGVEPPVDWLGKPHALRQAFGAARGGWLLATDADMIFEPRLLRTAMKHALANRYDALTLIPRVDCLTFWERVFVPTFGWLVALARPIERVNDPQRKESLGIGGFFLVRRAALERAGGYEAVAGEVAEDLRLAELLKQTGARLRVEYATDLLRTRMYPGFRGIWEGFTKNLFAGAQFSLARGVAGFFGLLVFHVAPFLFMLLCAMLWAAGAGEMWSRLFWPFALVWLTQVLTFALINRSADVPVWYALTVPLGIALFAAILLNSMIKITSGRGVTWKGRQLYERSGVRPPSYERK